VCVCVCVCVCVVAYSTKSVYSVFEKLSSKLLMWDLLNQVPFQH